MFIRGISQCGYPPRAELNEIYNFPFNPSKTDCGM